REKTYLLEHLGTKALGLVNDESRDHAGRPTFAQQKFETLEKQGLRPTHLRAKLELESEQADEVVSTKGGVVEIQASDVATSLGFERRSNQCRFAGSGLANKHGQRFFSEKPVLQDAQRFALSACEKQVLRIGRELKGELG